MLRELYLDLRKGILDGKINYIKAFMLLFDAAVFITVAIIILIAYFTLSFLGIVKTTTITTIIMIIWAIGYLRFFIFFRMTDKRFRRFSHIFGRSGKLISKSDWLIIKKLYPSLYNALISKKSFGYCYFYSREIALIIPGLKLMYCTVGKGDKVTGHSVLVKNNMVFDTNCLQHFDLRDYIQSCNLKVFKIYSFKEYSQADFFDKIRPDFTKWCADNNAYCCPQ